MGGVRSDPNSGSEPALRPKAARAPPVRRIFADGAQRAALWQSTLSVDTGTDVDKMRRRLRKVGAVNEIEIAEAGFRIRRNGANRNFQQL